MKKLFIPLLAGLTVAFFWFTKQGDTIKDTALTYIIPPSYVNEVGMTVYDRIKVPKNYKRNPLVTGSFEAYVNTYPLKEANAKVINYDGTPYVYQQGHVGVLEVPVPSNGLQQCADALMRLRAEYLWEQNKKEDIGFNFTSGHYCSWKQYAQGYRPKVNGNKVSFHKTAKESHTKTTFYKYLNLIYMYAGTQSLYDELPKISKVSNLKIGDMLIKPGSPGHVVMIADIVENENGNRLFVLLQGNTPAQSVHILKNPNDTSLSPWYELEMGAFVQIPTYYFEEAKFMRFL